MRKNDIIITLYLSLSVHFFDNSEDTASPLCLRHTLFLIFTLLTSVLWSTLIYFDLLKTICRSLSWSQLMESIKSTQVILLLLEKALH